MAFDPDQVSTITFDSYSTIVDVDAVEAALAAHVDDPEPVSRLWRARSLEYTFVANHIDAYKPFYEMNRDALSHSLAAHGVDLDEDEREAILETYHDLDVFDDVRDGIERLREGGYDCYVVSNGNPAMLDSMVEGAAIGDLLEDTISADEIGTFKPDAEIYRHAAGRTGTPIDEIAHVSAGWFDVQGATHAGMQGVWVDRKGSPWDPFDGDPDLTIETFHDLADELGV
ncbi:haloacid dehalogenase type II [Halococcus saccharolyticus]|uniref:Haloacid dehalogenase n=1 Tax=Halococcus saccharolyticus DSM 5350 TaxID=1227455 RepID=M0MGZ8_9EURY|nr:haloacid dehalogenase type II [Halococcus saccharolyticus]EMA43700.1 haloacid dehalogenase [Halococcus saccharolyticus DSM 5350]